MAASTTWPSPDRSRVGERSQDPHQQEHRPAAVVGHQVQRGIRTIGRADGRQVSRNRQIVDVMSGGRRQGPRLSPAGHAPVDERRIAGETFLGSEAEAFGHSRTVTFDQNVGRPARRRTTSTPAGCLRSTTIAAFPRVVGIVRR